MLNQGNIDPRQTGDKREFECYAVMPLKMYRLERRNTDSNGLILGTFSPEMHAMLDETEISTATPAACCMCTIPLNAGNGRAPEINLLTVPTFSFLLTASITSESGKKNSGNMPMRHPNITPAAEPTRPAMRVVRRSICALWKRCNDSKVRAGVEYDLQLLRIENDYFL